MPTQKTPSQQRISKSTGRVMLGVAVLFDLLPFLMIALVIAGTMYFTLGDVVSTAAKTENICEKAKNEKGFIDDRELRNLCDEGFGLVEVQLGWAAITGALAGIFVGPIVYTIGSIVATTLAYMVFIVWFYLKGVNILTFSSGERVLVNLLSIVIEYIPVVNLLPSITFGVWRHIKVSRAEDAIKDNELLSRVSKATNTLAYA